MTSPEAAPRTAAGRAHFEHHKRMELWHSIDGRRDEALRDILAIEAEAAAGTALDVERLAEAMWNEDLREDKGYPTVEQEAAWIAAEYARLAGVETK
jgi:hypothetical protein